jgi:hypothetical protein
MNPTHEGPDRAMNQGKSDPRWQQGERDLPEDEERTLSGKRSQPASPGDTAAHQDTVGRVPLEENQRRPSDPLKPGEEDEYGTRLEKAASKIVPPSNEISDEDIFDPGRMTPGAPPVDNRS